MPRPTDPKSQNQKAARLAKKARVGKSTARRFMLGLPVMPANERALARASKR